MSLLEVKDIYKSYGDVQILNGVSFTMEKEETKVIIGPSGTGKSTLLDLIEAEQTLVAANAQIGVAVANFLPRIGLTSVVGSQSGELADILASGTGFWGLIGSDAGPLLTFGRNWFTWRAAQQEAEAATAA